MICSIAPETAGSWLSPENSEALHKFFSLFAYDPQLIQFAVLSQNLLQGKHLF